MSALPGLPALAAVAPELVDTALRTVDTRFPYDHRVVYDRPGSAPVDPADEHPAFASCYDWHSSVEMHWVLMRLLGTVPAAVPTAAVEEVLDRRLTPAAVAGEVAALRARPWFERPYGWGWALTLDDAAVGTRWAAALDPLAEHLLDAFAAWLPGARYPVRVGLHANSAFGLLRALPAARRRRPELAALMLDTAERWYGADVDAPVAYEPSGSDFLSPTLVEAVLMTEVRADPVPWLDRFLPASRWLPAQVDDDSDGQTAHLHGLNLSRAWALRRLAAVLPAGDPRMAGFGEAAAAHAAAGLPHVSGSDYAVEHWLAAFALLALDPGL